MKSFSSRACQGFLLVVLALPLSSLAQTYKVVATLTGDNAYPQGTLIQGLDGNLYGTSSGYGGSPETDGTVFKVTPNGTVTTLYSFCSKLDCADGAQPGGGLLLAKNLDFYGTTESGGKYGQGTVFKLTPAGTLTTIYNFCEDSGCPDGATPVYGLVQGTDGLLFGSTWSGGAFEGGTIFSITTGGKLTTLYSFCTFEQNCPDGFQPVSPLVQTASGALYGADNDNLFKITTDGVFSVVYQFCSQPSCEDGNYPFGNITLSPAGIIYGSAEKGGQYGGGVVWSFQPSGGSYSDLYDFGNGYGAVPNGLVSGTDGNIYGTTFGAVGASGVWFPSTAYKLSLDGNISLLYTFCSEQCAPGDYIYGGFLEATSGIFYGFTEGDGAAPATVYSLSTALGPFVQSVPTSGDANSKVTILGTDLTGATKVTFNGKSSTFTVVSATEITATLPKGATSGNIQVTTPRGTLTSNAPFTVL